MCRRLLNGTLGPMKVGTATVAVLSAVALVALGAGFAVMASTSGPPTAAQNRLAATACREATAPQRPAPGEEEDIAVPVKWLRDLSDSGRPQLAALVTTVQRAGRSPSEGEQMIKALKEVVAVCKALHLRTQATPTSTTTPVPVGFSPVSVTFASAEVGWVLGTVPSGPGVKLAVAHTTDGGITWSRSPAPEVTFVNATSRLSGSPIPEMGG